MPTSCSSRPRPRHRPNQHALIGKSGKKHSGRRRRNDALDLCRGAGPLCSAWAPCVRRRPGPDAGTRGLGSRPRPDDRGDGCREEADQAEVAHACDEAARAMVRESRSTVRGREPLGGSLRDKNQQAGCVQRLELSERSRPCVVRGCREVDPPTDLRGLTGTSSPCSPPWRCACRTGRRIGREGLHRASCFRPLVDPVPVPGWLHGRRRPPDRGDGQLHRGGDDA